MGIRISIWLGRVINYYLYCWPCIKCGVRKEYPSDFIYSPMQLTYRVPHLYESKQQRRVRLATDSSRGQLSVLVAFCQEDGRELPTSIHDEGGEDDDFGVNPYILEQAILRSCVHETKCFGLEDAPHIQYVEVCRRRASVPRLAVAEPGVIFAARFLSPNGLLSCLFLAQPPQVECALREVKVRCMPSAVAEVHKVRARLFP
eukprot:scaffold4516_cov417-Prasinococcus_capsulatus_cf.AAC.21